MRDFRFFVWERSARCAGMEGDARACIEKRFTLFARLCRLQTERAGTWRQPRAVCGVQSKHAQTMSDAPTQSCWPPAEIQARITRDARC